MLEPAQRFLLKSMTDLGSNEPTAATQWIWQGYLARRNITLLTSQWKSGKTTLLAGLLHHLAKDGHFLGRACTASKVWVVSEEAEEHWIERRRSIRQYANADLLSRPFQTNPTPEDWKSLCLFAQAHAMYGNLDLLVVDTLSTFLPGRSEADSGTMLNFLHPLRNLAMAGAAVLVLHHPRKGQTLDGQAPRGSGVLSGYADALLELHGFSSSAKDKYRRRLTGVSRWAETPAELVYQWTVDTPDFQVIEQPELLAFQDDWELVRTILSHRSSPATHQDLLLDWPAHRDAPTRSTLYLWLNRALALGWVDRTGAGTKRSPYAFKLR